MTPQIFRQPFYYRLSLVLTLIYSLIHISSVICFATCIEACTKKKKKYFNYLFQEMYIGHVLTEGVPKNVEVRVNVN